MTSSNLDNGLVILVRENFSAPVVAIEGCIPCGSLHEASITNGRGDAGLLRGLAAFTAGMLNRGSRGYTQDAFDYYVTDAGKIYGVKCFYVMADGSIAEDIYVEG